MTLEVRELQEEKLSRRMIEAMAKRTKQLQEERALQQALLNNPESQYQHAEQEKQKEAKQIQLQTEQLSKRHAEQMAEVNALLASLPANKSITQVDNVLPDTDSTPTPFAEEQYQTTIVTNMIALIKQRKMK